MNQSRGKDISIEQLEELLARGDYQSFVQEVGCLPTACSEIPHFQLLSLKALFFLGKPIEALERAKALYSGKSDLTVSQIAKLEYLYLDWTFNGRQRASFQNLENELKKNTQAKREIGACVNEVLMRFRSTKLMLGLEDASSKAGILEAYSQLIALYQKEGRKEEAFFCLMQLVALEISKPFPSIQVALDRLEEYKQCDFIRDSSFKLGHVLGKIAELKLDLELLTGLKNGWQKDFAKAHAAYLKVNNRLGAYRLLMTIGIVFSRYGLKTGRKLLVRSIRYFESRNAHKDCLQACSHLLSMLHRSGDLAAVAILKEKQQNARLAIGFESASGITRSATEKDLAITVYETIQQSQFLADQQHEAKAMALINGLIREAKTIGESKLTADLLVQSSNINRTLDPDVADEVLTQAIEQYVRLGYHGKALNMRAEKLLKSLESETKSVPCEEICSCMESGESSMSGDYDMNTGEVLAFLYEACAFGFLKSGLMSESLIAIDKAMSIYERFGMKPRLALSLMCKAQVHVASGNAPGFQKAQECYEEAGNLFKLMNCYSWMARCQSDMAALSYIQTSGDPTLYRHELPGLDHLKKARGYRNQLRGSGLSFAYFHKSSINELPMDLSMYQRFYHYVLSDERQNYLELLEYQLKQN